MSIRSRKKINVNFSTKIIYTSFIITSWNGLPRYRSINISRSIQKPVYQIFKSTDYSIISHRQYSTATPAFFYHYINCISTLSDRIIQQLISTISRSFENLLHKSPNLPIYELSHNLNIQVWFSKWLTLTFDEKYPRIFHRKIKFHYIWKPVTIFTKSFNLRINLNSTLIPRNVNF